MVQNQDLLFQSYNVSSQNALATTLTALQSNTSLLSLVSNTRGA